MRVTPTEIPDVLRIEPRVFGDARGFFFESYNRRAFKEATGLDPEFVQDNHSRSARNVLRGLHYQVARAQGKLVRVSAGEVYDVVVDNISLVTNYRGSFASEIRKSDIDGLIKTLVDKNRASESKGAKG